MRTKAKEPRIPLPKGWQDGLKSVQIFPHTNLRKTFATRLLSRGAAITDVQHLLGHASVKTTEKAYAAFVKNERFKQTIDLLDKPVLPKLKVVR
jgi:site-specific recombinase XerD